MAITFTNRPQDQVESSPSGSVSFANKPAFIPTPAKPVDAGAETISARDKLNFVLANTPQEEPLDDSVLGFLGSAGDVIKEDFKRIGRHLYSGHQRSGYNFYHMIDNMAEIVSDTFGIDKPTFAETWKYDMMDDVVDPETMVDTLWQGLGAVPGELASYLIGRGAGGKVGQIAGRGNKAAKATGEVLGVAAIGGARRADEGPWGAAAGALEFAAMDVVTKGLVSLPMLERAVIGGTFFGGMSARHGEEAGIQGFVSGFAFSALGGKGNPNASMLKGIQEKVANSKAVRAYHAKVAEKNLTQAQIMMEREKLGMRFLEENYPSVAKRFKDSGLRPRVTLGKEGDVLKRMDMEIGKKLGMADDEIAKIPIDKKLERLFDSLDPEGTIPKADRQQLQHNYLNQMLQLSKSSQAMKTGADAPVEPGVAIAHTKAVHQAIERNNKATLELQKKMARGALAATKVALIDANATVKADILRTGGEAGKRAVMMHELQAGATPRAQRRFGEYETQVYKGLSRSEHEALDYLINFRRIAQIDEIHGVGKYKHPFGVDGKMAKSYIESGELLPGKPAMKPEQMAVLQQRADDYFAAFGDLLSTMRKEGLLDEGLYNKLKDFDYQPREFLRQIDRPSQVTLKGEKITVTDSGIQHLQNGDGSAINMNSRELLAQATGRVMNRIARNNTNKALQEFMQENPKNPIGKLPTADEVAKARHPKTGRIQQNKLKVPEDHFMVSAVRDGVEQPMFIHNSYADQWLTANTEMGRLMANVLRTASGSAIVRPLATGYNPGFVLTNMPRDLMHVWLTTNEHSSFLPIYAAQMGKDLLKVAPDAFRRTGRYVDYIEQGGGMNFLAHQGRDMFVGGKDTLAKQLSPEFAKTKAVLGYLNETSEIWVRLALRERAMKNRMNSRRPLSAEEAMLEGTHIARTYLDFAQGGTITKGIDNMFPYLNASTQAVRGVVRHAGRDPIDAANKVLQLMAVASLNTAYQMQANPEAWRAIPQNMKDNNYVFTTPFFTYDSQGNKRHWYATVKKENSTIPFSALAEAAMVKTLTGEAPDIKTFDVISQALPLVNASVPTMEALFTYASNYDRWFDREIWRGPDVPAEFEVNKFPQTPTNNMAVGVGQTLGLSPARLEAAVGKLIPSNTFAGLASMGWDALLGDTPEAERVRTFDEELARSPLVRRVLKLSHPGAVPLEQLDEVRKQGNTPRLLLNQEIDKLTGLKRQGQATISDIKAAIEAAPPHERERLVERVRRAESIDRAMRGMNLDNMPSMGWWQGLLSAPAETRAAAYHQLQEELSPRDRAKLDRLATRIHQVTGLQSDEFRYFLHLERQRYGSHVEDRGQAQVPLNRELLHRGSPESLQ